MLFVDGDSIIDKLNSTDSITRPCNLQIMESRMKCFLSRIRSYNYAVQSYTQFFVISDKTVLKWNIRRGHLTSIFGK